MLAQGTVPRPLPAIRRGRTAPALLVIALVAATTWAVMVADWVDGTGVTLAAAVVAAAEAVLIARSLVGRVVAGVAAPLLGLIVIVLLTLGSMPADGGAGLEHAVLRYAGALAAGLFQSDDWTFLVGLCGAMWLVGFWTGWVAVREQRGVLAVLPVYSVLAVNALNAPSLEHVLIPEACAVGLSLLVVTRTHLAHLESGWRRRRIIALPGTGRSFGRTGAAASGLVLLLALVVPPLTSVDISGRIFDVGSGQGGRGDGQGGLRGGGTAGQQAPIQFSADTRPGGALVADPRPVLSYTSENSESVYLRVVNDTVFDRGNWYYCKPPLAHQQLGAGGSVPLDAEPGAGAVGSRERRLRVRIVLDAAAAAAQADALFPGEPQSVLSAGRVPPGSAASCARSTGSATGGLLTVDRVSLRPGITTLDTVGLQPIATDAELRSAGIDYPAWTLQFTQLLTKDPADTTQKLAIQARAREWTRAYGNPYDRATAIETHLRSPDFTYTLTPPRPPDGTWPITWFLLTSHQGYCQYFASSMATMLRAVGIPARVVGGYGGGAEDDSSASTRTVIHRVTTTDAHNWVEAYFPHYGWIPFEPTPPSTVGGQFDTFPRGNPAAPMGSSGPPNTPSTPLPAPRSRTQADAPQGSTVTPAGGAPPGLVAVVAAALSLAAFTVVGWRWLAGAHGGGALRQRMRVLGLAFGVRRRPSDTDAGFARRLASALPADTTTVLHRDGSAPPGPRPVRAAAAEALALVAELSGKERYSLGGLLPAEEVRRRRAWQRVCRSSALLVWRRLLAVTARA
ncbi:MAG TPA: transglutaminase-like domain-containing protein [Candidatus Dormibacteraeota bacterium]